MWDNNLFLRNSTVSLTQTETGTTTAGVVTIKRTPAAGLSCVVVIPKQSAGDTLRIKLQHSTDNSSYSDLVSFDTVTSITQADTNSVILVRRFATEMKYVRYEATAAGTTPDYGAVKIMIGDRDQWNTLQVGASTLPGNTIV